MSNLYKMLSIPAGSKVLTSVAGQRNEMLTRDILFQFEVESREHDALPIEGRCDALPAFAAGCDERGDDGDEHEAAHCIRIAHRQPRRRPSGPEGARGATHYGRGGNDV